MPITASNVVSINFDELIFLYNRSSTNLFNPEQVNSERRVSSQINALPSVDGQGPSCMTRNQHLLKTTDQNDSNSILNHSDKEEKLSLIDSIKYSSQFLKLREMLNSNVQGDSGKKPKFFWAVLGALSVLRGIGSA